MSPQRTIIAHRHGIIAESIASALSRRTGVAPISVVTSEADVIRLAQPMDAVALDSGFATTDDTALRLRRSGVRVVLLGDAHADCDESLVIPLDASITRLARALLLGAPRRERTTAVLSPREREILSLVAQGFVAKQVARRLDISIKTVEHHKHRIYCKLAVPNQAAAIRTALVEGLV